MLNELVNHLNEAMQAIQSLQIQPTEHNCTRIVTALDAIKKAAQIGAEMNQQIPAEPAEPENAAEREEGTFE